MRILIVGAGLYGATMARILTDNGHYCKVVEKKNVIGGMCYDEPKYSTKGTCMTYHKYGPHVFHTDDEEVLEFIQKYVKFNRYIHEIIAKDDDGKIYHMPFNMHTIYDLFGVSTPKEAIEVLKNERINIENPQNLEEKALSLVGKKIYETLIKRYTTKQWGTDPKNLSPDIITRLPFRLAYDNRYFANEFCGVPIGGYTKMISTLLDGIDVELNYDILEHKDVFDEYDKVIYCGSVDELCDYELGELEYRSLRFKDIDYVMDDENTNGIVTINLVGNQEATREIEHIYFTPEVIDDFKGETLHKTLEFPDKYERGKERFYSINDEKNNSLYRKYLFLIKERYPNLEVGGRIGLYKYLDMDDTIRLAIDASKRILKN